MSSTKQKKLGSTRIQSTVSIKLILDYIFIYIHVCFDITVISGRKTIKCINLITMRIYFHFSLFCSRLSFFNSGLHVKEIKSQDFSE
jgi:hypothetical protein